MCSATTVIMTSWSRDPKLTMLTELKNRGVGDVLIACYDGLEGLPDAIMAVWPATTVQSCVVHGTIRGTV